MILKKIYYHKLNNYREKINSNLSQLVEIKINDPEIKEMLFYALNNGRRFRPLLFVLAHKIFKHDISDTVYQIATAIEVLHKASLIHDDLIDGDTFRRGKASFYHIYGDKKAIIAGDLLVSLAFEHFVENAMDPFLLKEWSTLYRLLSTGEMLDLTLENNWTTKSDKIEEMVYGKTASFLEFCMKAGTYIATKDKARSTLMGQFGMEVGFAFQIMNDLNNWLGIEESLGRLPQNDLNNGKVNPVTLLVYQSQIDGASFPELKEKIKAQIKNQAKQHVKSAYKILKQIDIENKYTGILTKILDEFDREWFWVDKDDK